jgi:hypothetical protein
LHFHQNIGIGVEKVDFYRDIIWGRPLINNQEIPKKNINFFFSFSISSVEDQCR